MAPETRSLSDVSDPCNCAIALLFIAAGCAAAVVEPPTASHNLVSDVGGLVLFRRDLVNVGYGMGEFWRAISRVDQTIAGGRSGG